MTTTQPNPGFLWDQSASTYAYLDESFFPAKLKMKLLRRYAKESYRCLDVGVANGLYSLPLAREVQSIEGVDISWKMLEVCRETSAAANQRNLFLRQASAENLPYRKESFDLVFCFAVLPLVTKFEQTLEEISRVLKKGGIAVLDITGRDNLSRRHWEKYYRSIGQFGVNSSTLNEIEAGLPTPEMERIEMYPIGVLDQWKYIPGINRLFFLQNIFHARNAEPDLDFRISKLFPVFANHYLVVMQKKIA